MAASVVAICNLALQKCEAARIAALEDDSNNARECDACYEHCRDMELRAHNWNFARKRVTLAPSSVEPEFDFAYAFPVPPDFMRLLKPGDRHIDWRIENHEDQKCILTNETDALEVNYIAKIEDVVLFDPLFDEMVACRMARQMCKKLTGSTTKKQDIDEEYKLARAEARRLNAFENVPEEAPEDPWLSARR
jgi:hypothetical protein